MTKQPHFRFSEWLPRGSDAETEGLYRAVEAAVEIYTGSTEGNLPRAALCLMNLADVLVSEVNDPTFPTTDDLRQDLADGTKRIHPGPRCRSCGKPM
jgi:hypothetical protein